MGPGVFAVGLALCALYAGERTIGLLSGLQPKLSCRHGPAAKASGQGRTVRNGPGAFQNRHGALGAWDDALQFADSAASMGNPVHFAGSDGGGGGRVPRSGSFQRLPALRALPTGLPRRRHRRRRVSLAQVYPRLYGGGYASGGHGANDRAYGM